ncbi:MAG: S4 domain-containing protein [Fimbriimonadaceae bacterium]
MSENDQRDSRKEAPERELPRLLSKNLPPGFLEKLTTTTVPVSGSALEAERHFVETYSERKAPSDAEAAPIPLGLADELGFLGIVDLIVELGLAKSRGNAKDLIKQGAVSIDGERFEDFREQLAITELDGTVLRVGKLSFRRLVLSQATIHEARDADFTVDQIASYYAPNPIPAHGLVKNAFEGDSTDGRRYSRTRAEAIIREHRVYLDGVLIRDPSAQYPPERLRGSLLAVDGDVVRLR